MEIESSNETFKPDVTSLINFDNYTLLTNEEKLFWSKLEWKRIAHIFEIPISLIRNASYLDPIQGRIGNCYLMSVCSAIAEHPNKLKQIFITQEINKAGIYAIQLYIDGVNVKVIVDDFIPVHQHSKTPVFAQFPKSRNIWPIIIEKAWAKQLGNYQNTISGHPAALFQILTGAPSETFFSSKFSSEPEINSLWKKLKTFVYNNYFVCASSSEKTTVLEKIGVLGNHAYTILFFEEFEFKGTSRKIVKLRNPWGKVNLKSLNEECLQTSLLEDEEVKRNIGKLEEGAFVLTFEDFLKCFSSTCVCKSMDNYKTQSLQLKSKNDHFLCIKVNLKNAEHLKDKIFFSVNKPTILNFIEKEAINKLYSSIFLGKRDFNGDFKFVAFSSGFSSSNIIELETYENCEYVILIYIDKFAGKLNNNLGFLSIYSRESDIMLTEEFVLDPNYIFSQLIYDFYQTYQDSFLERRKILSEDGLAIFNSFNLPQSFYSFVIFENFSTDYILSYCLDNLLLNDSDLGRIIIPQQKVIYEGDLQFSQYFLLCYFKSGITYKSRTQIMWTTERLKDEAKDQGEYHGIQYKNSTIMIKTFKHKYGFVFYVKNHYQNMVNVVINLKVINLFCLEIPDNQISLFAESEKEYFYFFEIIDKNNKFAINWNTKINGLE